MRIFKYPIKPGDYVEIEMPIGAQVLDVQVQHNQPCLWALVDPELPKEKRYFRFAGTGHPIKEDLSQLSHIGSFQLLEGALVFHLFEVTVLEAV